MFNCSETAPVTPANFAHRTLMCAWWRPCSPSSISTVHRNWFFSLVSWQSNDFRKVVAEQASFRNHMFRVCLWCIPACLNWIRETSNNCSETGVGYFQIWILSSPTPVNRTFLQDSRLILRATVQYLFSITIFDGTRDCISNVWSRSEVKDKPFNDSFCFQMAFVPASFQTSTAYDCLLSK